MTKKYTVDLDEGENIRMVLDTLTAHWPAVFTKLLASTSAVPDQKNWGFITRPSQESIFIVIYCQSPWNYPAFRVGDF